MRILLLVDCYLPVAKSGATQMHDLAMEFHRRNHEVMVLTPSDAISEGIRITTDHGFTVIRVKSNTVKGAGKTFRAVGEMRLSSLVWRRARHFLLQNPADLIVFYSPTIFWGNLVERLKSAWRCPSYLILRDIFPAWAVDAGLLRKGIIYRYFRKKEIQQYKASDWIAVQSPGDLNYFSAGLSPQKVPVEVLYNWMDLESIEYPDTSYRKRLGLQNKVVFFYGGNLGVAQDVSNIVRLATQLVPYPNIHFLLVGEGTEVPRLKKRISDSNLRNLSVLPAVDHREYLGMLSEFDVGLLSLDRRLKTHNVPGKLLGYMYWNKPVLASINPGNDLFELIAKNGAGYCLANGDDEGFCSAALRLANNEDIRRRMGTNSRKLLENQFSVEMAASQILAKLDPGSQKILQDSKAKTHGNSFS